MYFWLGWIFIARVGFLKLRQMGTALQLQCMGFPCCGAEL